MSFVQKRIQDQIGGFGTDLRELRELRGYSRDAFARLSGIHTVMITALEDEHLEDIADPVYAERHVRTLVRVLEGRAEFFLLKYRELLESRQLVTTPSPQLRRNVRKRDFFVSSRLFVFLGFGTLVAAVGGYVVWQALDISSPPTLVVTSPVEGERTASPHVDVVGVTDPQATIVVNGQSAIVESDGHFLYTLDVPSGVSTIRIQARRRYSGVITVERHLMFDRPASATSTP